MKTNTAPALWLVIFFSVLAWSAYEPKDFYTWFLEVAPALIGLTLIAFSRKSFPLTPMLYLLILIHCIILMIGGHYTYAEVPLFDTLKEAWNLERNNYDKVGHFAQGFIPAILAREILIRKQVVNGKVWLNFYIICICLAFSAFYELIEWWVALLSDQAAEAFLGTQGDNWDTQSDMFLALIGAFVAIFTLSNTHDRQLETLKNNRLE
jgi:putative membrane protein